MHIFLKWSISPFISEALQEKNYTVKNYFHESETYQAWDGFHKAIYALQIEQIYSNLASCICALRSTLWIVSQISGALYALRPAPNFYEIHPWSTELTQGWVSLEKTYYLTG
jgi:hypothetical protein